jgi:hypothetical protein
MPALLPLYTPDSAYNPMRRLGAYPEARIDYVRGMPGFSPGIFLLQCLITRAPYLFIQKFQTLPKAMGGSRGSPPGILDLLQCMIL